MYSKWIGVWRHSFFRFLLQQAPPSAGEPIGTDNIRLSLRLQRSGSLTGTFESNIRALDGTLIFTARGDFTAERISV